MTAGDVVNYGIANDQAQQQTSVAGRWSPIRLNRTPNSNSNLKHPTFWLASFACPSPLASSSTISSFWSDYINPGILHPECLTWWVAVTACVEYNLNTGVNLPDLRSTIGCIGIVNSRKSKPPDAPSLSAGYSAMWTLRKMGTGVGPEPIQHTGPHSYPRVLPVPILSRAPDSGRRVN